MREMTRSSIGSRVLRSRNRFHLPCLCSPTSRPVAHMDRPRILDRCRSRSLQNLFRIRRPSAPSTCPKSSPPSTAKAWRRRDRKEDAVEGHPHRCQAISALPRRGRGGDGVLGVMREPAAPSTGSREHFAGGTRPRPAPRQPPIPSRRRTLSPDVPAASVVRSICPCDARRPPVRPRLTSWTAPRPGCGGCGGGRATGSSRG